MLNLDTRIPLMVQERDYGRGFDTMQQAQENQLRLQALRDEYNAANGYRDWETDRKSTRLNSSHSAKSRMPSSA